MSRGTRITPLRLPPDLLERIDQAIASANYRRFDEGYNRTSWIVAAIEEKLDKLARGRRQHKEQAQQPQHGEVLPLSGPEAGEGAGNAGNGVEGRQ